MRCGRAPLDLATLAELVPDPRAAAVVLFEGVTREVPSSTTRQSWKAEVTAEGRARVEGALPAT
jgi:hypothetical protein